VAFDHVDLRTVGQIVAESSVLTRPTLYRLLKARHQNGLASAVVEAPGVALKIHRPSFNLWLSRYLGGAGKGAQ